MTVNLIRQSDGSVVQAWAQPQVAPGEVHTVRWTGVTGGVAQPEGRYAFRAVVSTGDATVTSASPDDPNRDAFDFHTHIFPVRANPHWTSSAISRTPCSSQIARSAWRNATGAG